MSRRIARGLLLVGALSMALLGSACSDDAAPSDASPRPPRASVGIPAPGTVKIGIVTKMDATAVSWTDGEIRPSETNDRTIVAIEGDDHKHSAPLAATVTLLAATGCGSATGVQVDEFGLGTATCTADEFRKQVLDNANVAPAITFDDKGHITKMAARYHP